MNDSAGPSSPSLRTQVCIYWSGSATSRWPRTWWTWWSHLTVLQNLNVVCSQSNHCGTPSETNDNHLKDSWLDYQEMKMKNGFLRLVTFITLTLSLRVPLRSREPLCHSTLINIAEAQDNTTSHACLSPLASRQMSLCPPDEPHGGAMGWQG